MFSRRPVILSYPKTVVGRLLVLHHPGHAAGGRAGWSAPANAEQGSVLSSMQGGIRQSLHCALAHPESQREHIL